MAGAFLLLAAVIVALGSFYLERLRLEFRSNVQCRLAAIADLKARQIVQWRNELLSDAQTTMRNPFLAPQIQALVQDWPGSDRTGETLLVRREGEEVFFLNDLRQQSNTALSLRLPVAQTNTLAVQAMLGRKAFVQGTDYHGETALGIVRKAPGSPWYLISKMDKAEAFAAFRTGRRLVLSAILSLLLIAGLLLGGLWRRREARFLRNELSIEKQRQFLAQRLLEIARQANDIIFLFDEQQNVIDANDRAVAAYGYSLAEFHGLKAAGLLPPHSRDDLDALQASVDAQKGLRIELTQQRKDGSTFPAEVSLRLVELEGKRFYQALLRDITERKLAEEKLRASEEKFRSLFESSRDAIMTLDPSSWRFTSGNKATLAMYGAGNEAQFITYAPWDLSPERQPDGCASAEKARAMIETALRAGSHYFEWTHRRLGGQEFLADVLLTRIKQGEKVILQATVRDITERKRAEEALRESESKLRGIFECSRDAIGISRRGVHVFVNPAYLHMFGIANNEQIAGASILNDIAPSHRQQITHNIERRSAGENYPAFYETRGVKANGEEFDMEVSVSTYQLHGEVYTIATLRDITARKRAEALNVRLAMAVEQASETIVITDTHGAILYVNPAFEKTTGYTRAEALGRNPRLLKSGKHDAEFYRRMWDILGRGQIWRGHFVNRRKDGTLFEEEATLSPVRDAAGQTINYVAVKRDVTREVLLEAQFRQAQKMEAIGHLAGGVAHDFNNILAALLMQTELAESVEHLSAESRDCLREIRASTERAANLTRQLLLFSRREVMQPRDLDLNVVVASLAEMLQRIIGEDVRLQLNLHPEPLMTHADAGMLDQVLLNLAVNARDAMSKGGRLLIQTALKNVNEDDARLNPEAVPGRYACLIVSDTGCGIAPEVLPRIFEPFFTTKEPGKGSGLGLATVFGIVKQHQGWLKVESKPGQGVTFQIFLPAGSAQAPDPPEAAAQPKPRGGTETILLVEDEGGLRAVTSVILARHGYHVLQATDGPQALKVWQEHRGAVALLLTDLVMPAGLSGQELARQLHVDQPHLKVIFTSGYSSEIAGQELQLRHGENFLQKPCAPDKLLGTIRQCLDA